MGRSGRSGGSSRAARSRATTTPAPAPGPRNFGFVVSKRLRIEGYIISDHTDRFRDFVTEVGPWVAQGKIVSRETVLEGIENVPDAFAGLFRGDNTGKMLVRVGPDESA